MSWARAAPRDLMHYAHAATMQASRRQLCSPAVALSSLAAYPKRKPDQPLISHVDLSSCENPNQPMHRQRQRRVPPFPSGSAASKFKGSPICSPSPIVLYPLHRTHHRAHHRAHHRTHRTVPTLSSQTRSKRSQCFTKTHNSPAYTTPHAHKA